MACSFSLSDSAGLLRQGNGCEDVCDAACLGSGQNALTVRTQISLMRLCFGSALMLSFALMARGNDVLAASDSGIESSQEPSAALISAPVQL